MGDSVYSTLKFPRRLVAQQTLSKCAKWLRRCNLETWTCVYPILIGWTNWDKVSPEAAQLLPPERLGVIVLWILLYCAFIPLSPPPIISITLQTHLTTTSYYLWPLWAFSTVSDPQCILNFRSLLTKRDKRDWGLCSCELERLLWCKLKLVVGNLLKPVFNIAFLFCERHSCTSSTVIWYHPPVHS